MDTTPRTIHLDHDGLRRVDADELARRVAAHAVWLAGDDAAGARAVFDGCALRGIDLAGADLRHAVFKDCDLTGADLSGAELEYADFTGAVLQDTRLHESDLVNASLCDTKSLSSKSLAGSILTNARLPADVARFDGLGRSWEIASRASNTFIALLTACVYSWLAVATTDDVRLVTNSATSPLPVFGTEIPIVGFYWAAPVILFGAHLYIHIYLQRLWQGYARLPAVFPDGMSLDQKAYPWLLSSLVQFNVRRLRDRQRFSACFDHMLSVILAWWLVPFTLFLFWLRFLPRHDWIGTGWHILLITASAAASLATYRLSERTLREIAHPRADSYVDANGSVWSHGLRAVARYRPSATTLCVAAGLLALSVGAIEGSLGRQGGTFPGRIVPDLFRALGYRAVADFNSTDVSVRPAGWDGADFGRVTGAMLQRADLRYADGRKAFLVNANLRSADISGADMKKADFQNADMDEVIARRADLAKADLSEVNLEEADLSGANLSLANLTGAILIRANVTGTNFRSANLFLTRLDEVDLREARNLTRAQLAQACADVQPTLPTAMAPLVLAPCPPEQGAQHRFDN